MFIFNPSDDSPLATEVPCVVLLSQPNESPRMYGPFQNIIEARHWCDKQLHHLNFSIAPLRRIDKDRESMNDWFGPEHIDIELFVDDIYNFSAFSKWQEDNQ